MTSDGQDTTIVTFTHELFPSARYGFPAMPRTCHYVSVRVQEEECGGRAKLLVETAWGGELSGVKS